MAILNQSVYYWNHNRGIEPTFVRVFQVMSGSLRPIDVGLTDENQWRSLLIIARWLRPLYYNNMTLLPLVISSFILTIYLPVYGWKITALVTEHIMIFKSMLGYYSVNIITTLLIFFIIICKFISFKLNYLNCEK